MALDQRGLSVRDYYPVAADDESAHSSGPGQPTLQTRGRRSTSTRPKQLDQRGLPVRDYPLVIAEGDSARIFCLVEAAAVRNLQRSPFA